MHYLDRRMQMEKYPKKFLDTDGYEWERGPFSFKDRDGMFQFHIWRFRPTSKSNVWNLLKVRDHYWDYAGDEQIESWGIKVSKVLE